MAEGIPKYVRYLNIANFLGTGALDLFAPKRALSFWTGMDCANATPLNLATTSYIGACLLFVGTDYLFSDKASNKNKLLLSGIFNITVVAIIYKYSSIYPNPTAIMAFYGILGSINIYAALTYDDKEAK